MGPGVRGRRGPQRRSRPPAWPACAAGDLVLAACSGGADSLALAAALAFVAPRLGLRAGGVTVDHGLQPGSAERAGEVAASLAGLGLDPVRGRRRDGRRRRGRAARRPRPARPATRRSTRPPRRTAPARSCSATPWTTRRRPSCSGWPAGRAAGRWPGCPPGRGRYRRPLLGRAPRPRRGPPAPRWAWCPGTTRTTRDPAYARARVRHQALPALEDGARPGGGRGAGPHRRPAAGRRRVRSTTWRPPRADSCRVDAGSAAGLDRAGCAALPAAIRARVLRDGGDRGRAARRGAHRRARRPGRRPGDRAGAGSAGSTCPAGCEPRRRDGKVWFDRASESAEADEGETRWTN